MRYYLLLFMSVLALNVYGQDRKAARKITKFQKHLNKQYQNKSESPLRGKNFDKFKEHPFFPIDLKYRVVADFKRSENTQPFELPTSSGKSKIYQEYGKATFEIDRKPYTLTLYQSLRLIQDPEYKDYLFLPFRDLTNGKTTYGAGRYLDLRIPKGNQLIIDFNQAYHPYCAYNAIDYSCPIVPEENRLPIEINAGVQYEDIWFEH